MNRNRKKAAAATLAAGMAVVLSAGTVIAAAQTGDSSVQKEETVYVNTTADGEVTDVTVSDWLKNAGDSSSDIKDSSDLTDIKNVKGDETFTQDGDNLTWSTDGKDIYYQGKSDKELPVSVNIKYYLKDGSVLRRTYTVPATDDMLKDPESAYGKVAEMMSDPDAYLKNVFGFNYDQMTIDEGYIDGTRGSTDEYWRYDLSKENTERSPFLPAEKISVSLWSRCTSSFSPYKTA